MNYDLRSQRDMLSDVEDREVLIVEDEKIIGMDIARRLDRMGFGISGAVMSAENGFQLAVDRRPSIISHGIHLNGRMDGIEGALLIKKELAIPVCMVTAFTDESTLTRACESRSIDGYIIKPWTENEIYFEFHRESRHYASVQARWDTDGIFRAARAGTAQDIRTLCSAGARTDARSPKGRTPLMHAAVFTEDPDVIRALVAAGADPDDQDLRGLTALMLAAGNPYPAIARALLEAGADPAASDAEGVGVAGHAPGAWWGRRYNAGLPVAFHGDVYL